MKIILYTTHCPRCEILKKKLDEKKISYEINENIQDIIDIGFRTAPVLKIDEKFYAFGEAVKWVNER